MANGSVYEKIIEKGTLEAQEIIRQGEEKANNMTEQVLQETDKKINILINETKQKNEDLIKTRLAEFEQNKKQKVLKNRKQIIKKVFNLALEHLMKINDEDLISLVINQLQKVELNGNESLHVNATDYKKYQMLFSSKHNNELDILANKLGCSNYHLMLSDKTIDIKGGFIIVGDYFDIDNSYEAILESLSEKLETEVASKLFGNEA